jgi:hypothetical protein
MLDRDPKQAVLGAFRPGPDFSGLEVLPAPNSKEGCRLLAWLDKSGLALSFLKRLQTCDATKLISSEWRQALDQRLASNTERYRDMLQEFQRLNEAFRAHNVRVACLKGFSLFPDFCEDPHLRHQTDFDFLVDPPSVEAAAEVLRSCGYTTPRVSKFEESYFTTPLRHIPKQKDNLYSVQRQRQVDLHTSIWEPSPWVALGVPTGCLKKARPMALRGIEFQGLSLEDRFLVQVLHVFRHTLRSWIRLSWLLEIGRCMEVHEENQEFWQKVIERAGEERLTRQVFALVLGMAERLFRIAIPPQMRFWTKETVTPSMRAWLDYFSVSWSISDWPGSLKNLFLAGDFIPDPRHRSEYIRSRLFPQKQQTTIGARATGEENMTFHWASARLQYLAHRSAVHLRDVASFPFAQIRWRKALRAARTAHFVGNLKLPVKHREVSL